MGSFYIELNSDEIDHAYLAVCHAIKDNTNAEAAKIFESILSRLYPYVSEKTIIPDSVLNRPLDRNIMEKERGINLKVKDLKECLNGLPDDMDVIIPCIDDEDPNHIYGYGHVRTVGILENLFEPKPALCLNSTTNGANLLSQVGNHDCAVVRCTKLLI